MITFSGIDCSGKSTQIENISRLLCTSGIKCKVIWSRGGYTPLLEFAKNIVRKDKGGTEAEHVAYRKKIHSNLKKRKLLLWLSICDMVIYYGVYFSLVELSGFTIIADRYIWDTYIDFKLRYVEFNFEQWRVWKILIKIYKKPKISIIYTISAEESVRRSELKVEPFPESLEKRKIRIEAYYEEIKKNRWQHVINAESEIVDVCNKTIRVINDEN